MCFFKQKTAYELRISDWSSDVCSSDLADDQMRRLEHLHNHRVAGHGDRNFLTIDRTVAVGGHRRGGDAATAVDVVAGGRARAASGEQQRKAERDQRPRSAINRSEEHTSELQSLMRISYAVFCLKK